MNNNNDRFLSAYNRLDNYLQSIVKIRGQVNMISYLERILPEKQAAECKTIRQFKNSIESHGVNPGYKKPNVPEEWIKWLLDELEWCKIHRNTIAPKLQKALDFKNNRQMSSEHPKGRFVPNQKGIKSFAIYIVSGGGVGGYFGGYGTSYYKTTIFKRSYYQYPKMVDAPDAKTFPTRGAAEFVAKEVRERNPKYHVSVVEWNSSGKY